MPLKQNKKREIEDHLRFISKKGEKFRTLYWNEHKINRVMRLFINFVKDSSNLRVLELGCGTGTFTLPLAKEHFSITGIDLVKELLKMARKFFLEEKFSIPLIACDAENLPFKESSFDIVFCSYFLHHFPSIEEVLKEINRVLKPDGRFFVLEANVWNPITWYWHRSQKAREKLEATSNERPFGPQYLSKNLSRNGFEVLNLCSINFDLFSGMSILEPYIERIPLLNLFGGSVVAFARKIKRKKHT